MTWDMCGGTLGKPFVSYVVLHSLILKLLKADL